MNMNRVALTALFSVLAGVSSTAYSSERFSDLNGYIGFDAQERFLKFKDGFGNTEFSKSIYPQGNVFLGLKFNKRFGFEVGYFSTTKVKSNSIASQNFSLGVPLDPGEIAISNNSVKLNGFNGNLVGFWPLNECNQLIGAIGLSQTHVKLVHMRIGNEAGQFSPGEIDAARRDFSKKKCIAQAKVGAEHNFSDLFGMRLILGWENTKRFKNLSPKQTSPLKASLKDSYTLGLGVVLHF